MTRTLRYAAVSVAASTFDFSVYFLLSLPQVWSPAACTLLSAACGGLLSWLLNRYWVFDAAKAPVWRAGSRYFLGVLLGIALNANAVWLLCTVLHWRLMAGRVASALGVWYLLYLFNRYLVFNGGNPGRG